jgi:putative DNA primase/helicase
MTSAATIARSLGGRKRADGYLCCCPVTSHGKGKGDRNPSLLIKDGDWAVLLKCFAGCDRLDILDELRRRDLIGGADAHQRYRPAHAAERIPDHAASPEAIELWRTAGPIAGTPAAQFLAARGLTITPPPSLRATSVLHLERYPLPAMVAAVQAPDRRVIAVQRTLIDPRGDRKAQVHVPRLTIGALGWGAIRLAAASDALGLAEGTEKALAAMELFGVPCWATLGTRMHRVWVPDHVHELHIFGDNDDPGRAAAERTAQLHRHRKVVLHFPPEQFKDWDDMTQAKRSAA